jgi:hypothetical protein
MPIKRKEFESGEPQPIFAVEEFLRSNPDYAYTVEELIVELAAMRVALKVDELREILSCLETGGKTQSKVINGVLYYVYSRAIGF